jgi:hypothetical protein
MKGGGDLLQALVDRCQQANQPCFASIRLNDTHQMEHLDPTIQPVDRDPKTEFISDFAWQNVDKLRDPATPTSRSGWDWGYPEIPAHKLAFIAEISQNYDIDGIELDFLRSPRYFTSATPSAQRVAIMTDFVRCVRVLLDQTAEPGRYRWLAVRVPQYKSGAWQYNNQELIGVDLDNLARAGADIVTLSNYFYTTQSLGDLVEFKDDLPANVALYHELHFTSRVDGPDSVREASPREHLLTTADLAYRNGVDGVEIYNFAYYRNERDVNGDRLEPPFDLLPLLGDGDWLASDSFSRWYFQNDKYVTPLPVSLNNLNASTMFEVEAYAAATPPGAKVLFRLLGDGPISGCIWSVAINGNPLAPTVLVEKPIDHPYIMESLQPENANRWACFEHNEPSIVTPGANEIVVTFADPGGADCDSEVDIEYFDLFPGI